MLSVECWMLNGLYATMKRWRIDPWLYGDWQEKTLQSKFSEKIRKEKLEDWGTGGRYRDTLLNMVTLSRSLDIPKPELSKYFSGLNTTFRFWLAEVRFEAAKKMILEKPNYSNDMISAECGFSSRSNLYRMFKEKEGCSPTAWREKNC